MDRHCIGLLAFYAMLSGKFYPKIEWQKIKANISNDAAAAAVIAVLKI